MLLMLPPSIPALAPFVQVFGYLEGPLAHARERVLPSGAMQLMVNLHEDEIRTYHADGILRHNGAVLQGPYDRASIIDTAAQRAIIWVTFRPGGAYPFFAAPSSEARSALVDLEALWGHDGATLRERLLEAGTPMQRLRSLEDTLLARLVQPLEPEPVVRYAVAALERGSGVADLTDRTGMSAKRLSRLFTDQVGLTPKRFARVRRFQRLIEAVAKAGHQPEWARLAVEHGFYDQAHMIHDFRALSGLSPTAYRPRSATELNHVPL